MNFNQFGMANFIVNEVDDVDVCIMSIFHSHIIHRNQYMFSFLHVEITLSKTGVKRS